LCAYTRLSPRPDTPTGATGKEASGKEEAELRLCFEILEAAGPTFVGVDDLNAITRIKNATDNSRAIAMAEYILELVKSRHFFKLIATNSNLVELRTILDGAHAHSAVSCEGA
jgi:hypothetical protein